MEKLGLPYPMLCDEDGTVIRAFGVKGMLGFAKRVSFLIDPEGKVDKVYTKVSPDKHAAEVLDDLQRVLLRPGR